MTNSSEWKSEVNFPITWTHRLFDLLLLLAAPLLHFSFVTNFQRKYTFCVRVIMSDTTSNFRAVAMVTYGQAVFLIRQNVSTSA
jgi:hypothetical protein